MRRALASGLGLWLCVGACDDGQADVGAAKAGGEEAVPEAERAPPAPIDEAEPPPAHEPRLAPTNRPKATPEQIKSAGERGRAFRVKLDAGRKASRDGDYAAAFEAFSAARKLRPHDPRVLGELGFASYKARKLVAARRWTVDAIGRATEDKRLGALHYNLGLISEAEGQPWTARTHYELSLKHRPNETVAASLEQVADATPPAPVHELQAYCTGLARELDTFVDPDDEVDPEDADPLDESWTGCSIGEHVVNPTADGTIREAAILTVGFEDPIYAIETDSILAVKTLTGGWQLAFSVPNSWIKEFCDSDTDSGSITSLKFEDVGPGPGSELVAKYSHYFQDMPEMIEADENGAELVETTTMGTVLCSGAEPACVRWETSLEIASGDFDWNTLIDPTITKTHLEERFVDGALELKLGAGSDPTITRTVGRHPVTALFGDDAFTPRKLR